ncbi:MAG TPA: hypothetical protein PLB62_13675, partial [Candidatus Sumerlaeota bacterium]|nr:hypothetical protein [Candidatus Sumerlaeota bacterium]
MSFAILTRGKIAAMILALALPMLLCILSCNLGGKPAVVMPPAADVQPDTAPSDTAPSDKGTAVAAKIENRSML